jgi:hypothetical protein
MLNRRTHHHSLGHASLFGEWKALQYCFMTKHGPLSEDLPDLAREAKAIVAFAFRNGPIENVHAGRTCSKCHGKAEYSHITQDEMREIMKSAVNRLYTLLVLKKNDRDAYERLIAFGERYTSAWDEPALTKDY